MFNIFQKKHLSPPVPTLPTSLQPVDAEHVFWAMCNLRLVDAKTHFLALGSTGSGKTTLLRLLMQSVLPKIATTVPNMRALVYDSKRDMIPIVAGILEGKTSVKGSPPAPPIILNPFDERTSAWDLSADVTTPRHAAAVAAILIPEEPKAAQRFFSDAARSLLATVMTAFALASPKIAWTLRDVILALRTSARLQAVAKLHESTWDRAIPYLQDALPLPSILSTIATKLDPLEIVAALWQRAINREKKFSISDWLASQSILILGSSPPNRDSLNPINVAIFRRLTDLMLEQADDQNRYTWLFLDELREAGELNGLSSLLNQGRSKGACMVLGFQDIEGFQAVYGDKVAGEICGQCAHAAFLRTNSHKTAEWVQQHCGENLVLEEDLSQSTSWSKEGSTRSETVAYHRQVRKLVYASELIGLPPTNADNGLTAFYDLPGHPIYRLHTSWEKIEELRDDPADHKKHPPTKKWEGLEAKDEILKPWDSEDFLRLHLASTAESPKGPVPVVQPLTNPLLNI